MEISPGSPRVVADGDGKRLMPSSSSISAASAGPDHLLPARQASIIGSKSDGVDCLSWRLYVGTIIIATVGWLAFELAGLPFLSICSDVLLVLIVLLFMRSNYASLRNKHLQTLPELVVSEEMVNNVAASFRVKFNNMLLAAHEITLGKDFRLFFKVVVCLWILSVLGSYCSFFTLAYISAITLVTVPALYKKNEDRADRYFGLIRQQFSKDYKVVDENFFGRLPRNLAKDKDS